MTKKREEVTEVDQKMHDVSSEIDSLLLKVQEFQSLDNRLNQKIHQMQVTGENRDELASNMTMMTQSDRELERMREQHQSRISADEEARQVIKAEQAELELQLKQYQQQVLAKVAELGKLEAEKTANEQRVKDRKQIILKANQRYASFDFNDENITDEDVMRFEERLTRSVQEKQKSRIRLKKDASDAQEQLEIDIQTVRSEKTSLEEGRKYAKKQIEINQQNIKRVTDQMHGIKASKSELEYLQQKLENAQTELKNSKNESLSENLPEQLAKREKELRDVDDGISALNDEIAVLNKQGDTRAKLSLKKQDRDRLSATANGLLSECKEQVVAVLGSEPSIDSLGRDIDTLLDTKEQELKVAQEQWSTALTDLSSIETKLKMAQEDLDAKKSEYQSLDRQIKDICKEERLPDLLADCVSELEENKSMLSGVDGAIEMYKRFLAAARKSDSCPLCRRGFHDSSELEVLVKKLDELMIKQPQQAQGIKQEIEELEQRHNQLKLLEPSWNRLVQLRDSLLDAGKSSVSDLKEKKRRLKDGSEKVKDSISSLEQEKSSITGLRYKSEDITRLKSEIRVLSDDISTLEEELSLSGSTKTVDDYSIEMEQLTDKGRVLRRAVKTLQDDRNRQTNKLQMLEGKVRDAKDELSQMQQKLQTKEDLQRQIDGLIQDNKGLEPSQSQTDDKISSLSSRIEELTQSLRTFQKKSAQEQDELQQEINSMEQDLERLKSSTAAIQRYLQTAGPNQLERCYQEKQALDRRVEFIVRQNNEMSSKLADMDKRLNQAKTFERDLSDNLRYRAAVASIENLQEEIRELQQQMRQWDDSTYERQLETLQNQQAEFIDKLSEVVFRENYDRCKIK
ncbi:DNA repair protein rad50 [Umbelopsis sp. WA50703]